MISFWTHDRFKNIEAEALASWAEPGPKDYPLMRRYVIALQYLTIRRQRRRA